MEITITRENINGYSNGIFPKITKIKWLVEECSSVITNFPTVVILLLSQCNILRLGELKYVITNFPNLSILYCENNKIATLEPLSNLTNLSILNCGNNKITTLGPLSNLTNLIKLDCYDNKITTLEPLSNLTNLKKISFYYNKIMSLEPLSNLTNLNTLDCWNNQITTLEPLSNLTNLRKLNCSNNRITSLEPLSNLTNLRKLNCGFTEITSLEPLSNLTNLRRLCCYYNRLTSLEPLSNLVNLRELYCSNNEITSLDPLSNLTNLRELYFINNEITSLDPLANLTNLNMLWCTSNRITTLEPLIYLRNIRELRYSGNPLEIQTVQVQRFLDRFQFTKSSIYEDNQNVHDVTIQKTVCDSIRNLLRDPKPTFYIDDIINSDLDKYTIEAITEYCQNGSIHSVHLITYGELFSYVWQRIDKSEYKIELIKILREQIHESECKCFTGRFNRTLSVLVGFFDDININISDNSRISAIILNLKDRIIPYNVESHKEAARRELIELGYNEVKIEIWIDAIDDS